MTRRLVLLLVLMSAGVLLAGSVAIAATKVGNNGNNFIKGTNGQDTLVGKGGHDTILGRKGNDDIVGGSGNDRLYGGTTNKPSEGKGKDVVSGESGNDRIKGGYGADVLTGGPGKDKIIDGSWNDKAIDDISGGRGDDRITTVSFANARDNIKCGSGHDILIADPRDIVAKDCEKVRRRSLTKAQRQKILEYRERQRRAVSPRNRTAQNTVATQSTTHSIEDLGTTVSVEEYESKVGPLPEHLQQSAEELQIVSVPMYEVDSPEEATRMALQDKEASTGDAFSAQAAARRQCATMYAFFNPIVGQNTVSTSVGFYSNTYSFIYWSYLYSINQPRLGYTDYGSGGGPMFPAQMSNQDVDYMTLPQAGYANGIGSLVLYPVAFALPCVSPALGNGVNVT